jgi:AcrR family transcriptional regulator
VTEPAPSSDEARSARRPRRTGEQQRAQILQAARAEFVKSGFAGTKMREIAAVADVNDALLYRHFKSKSQLFDAAVFGPLEDAVKHTFASATAEGDVRDVSLRFITELLEVMREIAPLLIVVLADAERGAEFYRTRLQPALTQVASATEANLGRWDHQSFDPALLARLAWGACWFIALDERFGDSPPRSPEAVAPDVFNIIWDGLRARPDV